MNGFNKILSVGKDIELLKYSFTACGQCLQNLNLYLGMAQPSHAQQKHFTLCTESHM